MLHISPLAIIQARYRSTRLPGKVLLPLGGKSLLQRAWETTCEAFGQNNTVVATAQNEWNQPIIEHCTKIGAECFAWEGDENDVLGRFHAVAHAKRWHPDSVIVRVTPDDWDKRADHMEAVVRFGLRLPVEQSCEAFTLAQLDEAHRSVFVAFYRGQPVREHLTYALSPTLPPKPPVRALPWSIDTQADYDAVKDHLLSQSWTSPFDGGPWSPC